MNTAQVIDRLNRAWAEFEGSYEGLTSEDMLIPGVTGNWSVRDIIAHVTVWEEEALRHLPLVMKGGRPPRYSTKYGGIDAFNALMAEERSGLSLTRVMQLHNEVHERLLGYVWSVPEELFHRETRFRRRLRLDTWGHYPIHAAAIRRWRGLAGNA